MIHKPSDMCDLRFQELDSLDLLRMNHSRSSAVRGLGIFKSLDVSVCGLSGSLLQRAFPFIHTFLVAGLDLRKRRKPRPAGYMSSAALILRVDARIRASDCPQPP